MRSKIYIGLRVNRNEIHPKSLNVDKYKI